MGASDLNGQAPRTVSQSGINLSEVVMKSRQCNDGHEIVLRIGMHDLLALAAAFLINSRLLFLERTTDQLVA